MELKGSRTEKNLWEAFEGESQARSRYTLFASRARSDGFIQIADIFSETAANEQAHAQLWFRLLQPDETYPSLQECLRLATHGERAEWADMYPRMAREAQEEGFARLAALFRLVGSVERRHEQRYLALLEGLNNGTTFSRSSPQPWVCSKCGYVHTGTSAPGLCPVCGHPQGYFCLQAQNY